MFLAPLDEVNLRQTLSHTLHTHTHTAPSASSASVGTPAGKKGDSDTDSGKGNVNAVPDMDKTLPGQDSSNTDNSRKENNGGNKQIVPGQIFSPSLSIFLSLSPFLPGISPSTSCSSNLNDLEIFPFTIAVLVLSSISLEMCSKYSTHVCSA